MDELKTHYVESMEASGEMTKEEAAQRFDQLMHQILVQQETAAFTLTPAEWETKREAVARVLLNERPSLFGGIPEDGIGLRRYLADAAMIALGLTRASE